MRLSDLTRFTQGLLRQAARVARNPRYLISGKVRRQMRYDEVNRITDTRERFERIYESRVWRGSESASGAGSSLQATAEVRQQLPRLISAHAVDHLLDAPCGDFHWMKIVVEALPDLQYTGADIVERLIEKNRNQYGSERVRFEQLDITRQALPRADMMMVRDCLFHLSYADIGRFLHNLAKSDVRLLLTTSNVIDGQTIRNRDIASGDFRPIDLFSEPFCFPETCLDAFDDHDVSVVGKRLYLFEVESLIRHLEGQSPLFRSTSLSETSV